MLSKISRSLTLFQKRAMQIGARQFSQDNKGLRTAGASGLTSSQPFLQFSKDPVMGNFGDLPFGEIPEPLKFNRPFQHTTLSNGIRVCSEKISGKVAHVGVYVGAGSRNETPDTNGTAYLLEKMALRGTNNRSKTALSEEIENMGATYSSKLEKEQTSFGLQVFKGDTAKAVGILGDIVCNSSLNSAELELLKDDVSKEHESNHTRYEETLLSNVHYNSYREHMIGQPTKGDRDLTHTLGVDHLRDFHAAHYFGDNVVVVATGDVNHDEVVEQVQQHFGSMPKTTDVAIQGTSKPIYIPAVLFMRDDEMVNSNVGVFYDAPSVKDEDFFSFVLLKHMFGQYRIDQHAEHLNDCHKQYNSMHALLGALPDVTRADAHYMAYSDCGLFGNYFYGNEVFTRQMNYCGVCLPTIYSHYLNDVEVVRGRNNLYNNLMTSYTNSTPVVNAHIGKQMLLVGRRVPRSEVATRIAHIDNYHIKHLCNEWFYDAEPCFTSWGPIETVSHVMSYKYFKVNTMSTVLNTHHTLFN